METGCLDELSIVAPTNANNTSRYGFIPSAATTTALEDLVSEH